MLQQGIAILIIIFFLFRLFLQKKKNNISGAEFNLWFIFWSLLILLVIFLKQIDSFVAYLGFSSKGIDVLLYLSITILFYLLFRARLKMEKQEKNITKLTREMSILTSKIKKDDE